MGGHMLVQAYLRPITLFVRLKRLFSMFKPVAGKRLFQEIRPSMSEQHNM